VIHPRYVLFRCYIKNTALNNTYTSSPGY